MPKPTSKRQRKQKSRNSCRQIKAAATTQPVDIDAALLPPCDDNATPTVDDSNALLLPANRKRAAPNQPPDDTHQPLTKAQKRKQRRIAEERAARQQHAAALATLHAHALAPDTASLMRSVAQRGQRLTVKESLRRDLAMQRAGLALPTGSRLMHTRPSDLSDDGSEQQDSGDEEQVVARLRGAMEAPAAPIAAPIAAPVAAPVAAPATTDDVATPPSEPAHQETPAERAARHRAAALATKEHLRAHGLLHDEDEEQEPAPSLPSIKHDATPLRVVHISRPEAMQQARAALPIANMEQEIMEAVHAHDVVVLAGATGCGKTTQVPQFLLEAGYGCDAFAERGGMVGVTQPRRVAAIATAARVAEELGQEGVRWVGHQVRHQARVSSSTRVKFMTDGILLRELQGDFLLQRYSCLLVDEAHERSLNTDLLIGMLSRVVTLRRSMYTQWSTADPTTRTPTPPAWPLKLLIMSATLRTDDFVANARLFPRPPPLLEVPSRQFPVTVHFSRRTELRDYVGAAFRKVCSIHRKLPPGGVLVFLTGQREVQTLVQRLQQTFDRSGQRSGQSPSKEAADDADALFGADAADVDDCSQDMLDGEAEVVSEDELLESGSDEDDVVVLGGESMSPEEVKAAEAAFDDATAAARPTPPGNAEDAESAGPGPVLVLPLYALLPPEGQARVFAAPPPGTRLIVVATNVAETSLTIPGMRYVVDAGRSKQKLQVSATGAVARFEVDWISKASAEQRAGRAGRTGPGHCYRLYSSAHFNDSFPQHTPPEILGTPLDHVALALKSMGVDRVARFPFPTPPPEAALLAALQCLHMLGALRGGHGDDAAGTATLTALGARMAKLPVTPRHARMLLEAAGDARPSAVAARPWAVALTATMSLESPLLHDAGSGEDNAARRRVQQAQRSLQHPDGEPLTVVAALAGYEAAASRQQYCRDHGLHPRLMSDMAALHRQLRGLVHDSLGPLGPLPRCPEGGPVPPPRVSRALRRAMVAGWVDRVARRAAGQDAADRTDGRRRRVVRYEAAFLEGTLHLHPSSPLAVAAPEYVVFTEVVQTEKRAYMRGVCAIDPAWIYPAAPSQCVLSPPLPSPPPAYDAACDSIVCHRGVTFGNHQWALPPLQAPLPAAPPPGVPSREAVFGAALLSGFVGGAAWASLASRVAAQPSSLLSVSGMAQARCVELIHALSSRGVVSRATLVRVWATEPAFLRREVGLWVQREARQAVLQQWPQLVEEVVTGGVVHGKGRRKRRAA